MSTQPLPSGLSPSPLPSPASFPSNWERQSQGKPENTTPSPSFVCHPLVTNILNPPSPTVLSRVVPPRSRHRIQRADSSSIELYSALDINVGLIVACLPSLRPYLRMFSQSAIVSRITSRISKDKSGGSKNVSEDGADVEMGSGRQHKKTGWTDICEDTVYESRSESPRRAHDSDIELIQGSGHVGVAS